LDDLRDRIRAFIEERDWEQFHSPKDLAMALSVEVSEIVEQFQWLTEEQSQNLPPKKLAEVREEIGDVMVYLTELADKLGIDPVEAAKAKVAINGKEYPAEMIRGIRRHTPSKADSSTLVEELIAKTTRPPSCLLYGF
jgi:dCTP diphosphatase